MATITVPNTRVFAPVTAEFGLRSNVVLSTSPLNGATQTTELPGARWVSTWTFNNQANDDRARVEALFAKLRGQANRLSAGHPLRRLPRGTMRSSPSLSGAHAQFATTLNISGTGTLLEGDMLGVGGYLYMVTADCLSGLTAVPISPPLRVAASGGSPVTWDWPRTLWIPSDSVVRVTLGPKVSPGFSVELIEVFA